MPMPAFTAQLKRKSTQLDKPILIGRGNSQARISVREAKELYTQLGMAIHMAEVIAADKSFSVTPRGLILDHHKVNGFKYFTCSNIR